MQVIEALRADLGEPVPALIVSAEGARGVRRLADPLGVPVLEKPVAEGELRRVLQALLEGVVRCGRGPGLRARLTLGRAGAGGPGGGGRRGSRSTASRGRRRWPPRRWRRSGGSRPTARWRAGSTSGCSAGSRRRGRRPTPSGSPRRSRRSTGWWPRTSPRRARRPRPRSAASSR